jgi:site-specific recombinase XerD
MAIQKPNRNRLTRTYAPPVSENAAAPDETTLSTDMNSLIGLMLQEFVAIEGKAKSTARTWGPALHRFTKWVTEREGRAAQVGDFNLATLEAFNLFLATHRTRKLGVPIRPRTRDTYVMSLRALGRYLVRKEFLTENPANKLLRPKFDPVDRRPITDEEFTQLQEGCSRIYPPERAAIARAIVCILGYTGLRRAEVIALRLNDVILPTPTEETGKLIVQHGKGNKRREVFMPTVCSEAIRQYIKLRPQTSDDHLLMYDRRRHFADRAVTRLFAEIKAAAGLADRDHITCHPFRHGYASRLLKNGADLLSISKALGHSSLQTTSVYLHTDEDQLKEVARLAGVTKKPKTLPAPDAIAPTATRRKHPLPTVRAHDDAPERAA